MQRIKFGQRQTTCVPKSFETFLHIRPAFIVVNSETQREPINPLKSVAMSFERKKLKTCPTSCLKLWLPGTLEIVLAMWREQNAAMAQIKTRVNKVGIKPERRNVAGRWSIAGPVKELQAMANEPKYPILPVEKQKNNENDIINFKFAYL